MPRKKRNKNLEGTEEDVEKKVAKIGEFAVPKEGAPEEIPPNTEEIPETELPPEGETPETPQGINSQELKEKLVSLLAEAFSKGLSEEEKNKFVDNFKFWNELLFNFLDIGDNLSSVLEKAKVQLTPGKALAIYAVGTGALLFALRPDMFKKIGKGKQEQQKSEPVESPSPVENPSTTPTTEEKVEQTPEK